jgi:hypothetical protein
MAEVNYSLSMLNVRRYRLAWKLMRDCRRVCRPDSTLAIDLARASLGALKMGMIGGGKARLKRALGMYKADLAKPPGLGQVEQE